MPILGGGASTRAGTVQAWPSNTIPSGWLKCNGAAISRTLYAALFNEIGTTYGAGDGSTTFNVPDLRAHFVRGLDDGRGIDSGRTFGTAQPDQNASHSHGQHNVIYTFSGGGYGANFAVEGQFTWPNGTSSSARSTGASGGGEARPRNLAMHYIIKF